MKKTIQLLYTINNSPRRDIKYNKCRIETSSHSHELQYNIYILKESSNMNFYYHIMKRF